MPKSKEFWLLVDRRGPDDCWPWQGGTIDGGYGRTRIGGDGKKRLSHVLAFLFSGGELTPEKNCVLHSCDNPPCCNPAHLFAGSRADNIADMDKKNRRRSPRGSEHWSKKYPEKYLRGEAHKKAKLTVDGVARIRSMANIGVSQRAIARAFGVGKTTVAHVLKNNTWRHVQ